MLPFLYLCAVPDTLLLHIPATLRRRNITVLRNSFARCYGRHLRIVSDVRLYRRVRRLGAPYQTTCTRVTVGAVIGRPRNRKSSRQFSILHFPFSIIQPHKKGLTRRVSPFSVLLFCLPLLDDVFAPALHDRCDLGTGGGAGRCQTAAILTVQHACADCPLQSRNRVLTCLLNIHIAAPYREMDT